jgi:hypothetical protein
LKIARITWHSLRHSHATLLDTTGAPLGTVQALLGHATSEITREIYLHAIPEDQRRAVANDLITCAQKWLTCFTPFFTAEERKHACVQHRLFFAQVEFCDNLIFRR